MMYFFGSRISFSYYIVITLTLNSNTTQSTKKRFQKISHTLNYLMHIRLEETYYSRELLMPKEKKANSSQGELKHLLQF